MMKEDVKHYDPSTYNPDTASVNEKREYFESLTQKKPPEKTGEPVSENKSLNTLASLDLEKSVIVSVAGTSEDIGIEKGNTDRLKAIFEKKETAQEQVIKLEESPDTTTPLPTSDVTEASTTTTTETTTNVSISEWLMKLYVSWLGLSEDLEKKALDTIGTLEMASQEKIISKYLESDNFLKLKPEEQLKKIEAISAGKTFSDELTVKIDLVKTLCMETTRRNEELEKVLNNDNGFKSLDNNQKESALISYVANPRFCIVETSIQTICITTITQLYYSSNLGSAMNTSQMVNSVYSDAPRQPSRSDYYAAVTTSNMESSNNSRNTPNTNRYEMVYLEPRWLEDYHDTRRMTDEYCYKQRQEEKPANTYVMKPEDNKAPSEQLYSNSYMSTYTYSYQQTVTTRTTTTTTLITEASPESVTPVAIEKQVENKAVDTPEKTEEAFAAHFAKVSLEKVVSDPEFHEEAKLQKFEQEQRATFFGTEVKEVEAAKEQSSTKLPLTPFNPVVTTQGPITTNYLKENPTPRSDDGNKLTNMVEQLENNERVPVKDLIKMFNDKKSEPISPTTPSKTPPTTHELTDVKLTER